MQNKIIPKVNIKSELPLLRHHLRNLQPSTEALGACLAPASAAAHPVTSHRCSLRALSPSRGGVGGWEWGAPWLQWEVLGRCLDYSGRHSQQVWGANLGGKPLVNEKWKWGINTYFPPSPQTAGHPESQSFTRLYKRVSLEIQPAGGQLGDPCLSHSLLPIPATWELYSLINISIHVLPQALSPGNAA